MFYSHFSLPDNAHYHWHVCTVEDCEEIKDKAECTPVYEHDAEGHWQICEVCEAVLTEKVAHIWDTADSEEIEILFDAELGLHYIECVCGERLYDELVEVIIGKVSYTVGEGAPTGKMQIVKEDDTYKVSYSKANGEDMEDLTLRCRVYINGEWDGTYLVDNEQGIYEITPDEGSAYKVVLEVANATGMSIFEKIIGL